MKNLISDIKSRMILDSRGNPTVEAEVIIEANIIGRASVPSGASTGTLEAHELRDEDEKFFGKGVSKALKNIDTIINEKLVGQDVSNQEKIDDMLLKIDGSKNKENLGSNAILAVSLACYKAFCIASGKNFYEMIPSIYGPPSLPVPFMNILNGGAHADNNIDIQEFMIVPHGFSNYKDSLRAGVEVYHKLKDELKKLDLSTNVGDEGGFAPNFQTIESVMEAILKSISLAGYTEHDQISLALDVASTEFYKDGKYLIENEQLSNKDMVLYIEKLVNKYPIISVEDGIAEDDWEGWKDLTNKLGTKTQLVGDDLFVTNKNILLKGVKEGCANSILIKLNQVGTVSETLKTLNIAKENNYTSIISHRSGETEDTFISHLAVGACTGQIKIGAPARSERTSKYNEILRIAEHIGFENFNNKSWKK